MNWNKIVGKVKPHIVKIKTPTGDGTGFLCLYNKDKTWFGIATAEHVVQDADEWKQPIKLIHNNKEYYINDEDRVIYTDKVNDSAIILVMQNTTDIKLPKEVISLRPLEQKLDIGSEVGWIGYPYIEANTLCFFSGNISARNDDNKYYLIDGVAINGVSGGPVLYSSETEGTEIIGIMTAYRANRATGSPLPGLSIAQDVHHLHKSVEMIKNLDEAREKKKEMKGPEPQKKKMKK